MTEKNCFFFRKRKNAGTQTDTKIDTMVEIARLEEEVKLLTIENKHLRSCLGDQKFMKTSLPHPNDIEKCNETVLNSSQIVQKKDINIMPHCSCKTKCSTKRCRCLKRNIPCGQSCKCNTNICLNQVNNIFYFFFLIDL